MIARTPVKRKRSKPRRGRVRDPKYLAWIRTLPCILSACEHCRCFICAPIEAAHVGERGLGQKCSDRETVPLCAAHHRLDRHSHHRLGHIFWTFHGLTRDAIIADLNARYEREMAA